MDLKFQLKYIKNNSNLLPSTEEHMNKPQIIILFTLECILAPDILGS